MAIFWHETGVPFSKNKKKYTSQATSDSVLYTFASFLLFLYLAFASFLPFLAHIWHVSSKILVVSGS